MIFDTTTLLIGVIAGISSALIGLFLILRKMSMLIDAISHTVLFGIVIAFLLVKDINSPFLLIFAALVGVLTAWLIELLVKSKRTTPDAATGVVFPLIFAIAIILLSSPLMRDAHLCVDNVFLGQLELVKLDKVTFLGFEIPRQLISVVVILIINILFILIFYKELKIVSFDPALATVLGISPVIIHYLLMTLVSVTAVNSFNIFGVITVVALMVGPGATALLVTKKLNHTIILSAVFAVIDVSLGYFLASLENIPSAALIPVSTLIVFLVVLFINPKSGIISVIIRRQSLKKTYSIIAMIIHIDNHQDDLDPSLEISEDTIQGMLNWSDRKFTRLSEKAIKNKYIFIDDKQIYRVTEEGYNFVRKYK